ncbi:MAG: hypothetical protein Q8S00_13635 [Deltaproteobacteria bacterium]|nr:hypothetical protein [Deltaproteobacteria bacterium]
MRAALLETYVTPVFAEFEQVHSAYLESFSRYRDLIRSTQEPNWIQSLQATLEKDNLFSANCRAKVVRLAEAEDNDTLGPFVKDICEYLMGARLVDPLGNKIHPLHAQRWRQSLFRTLSEIAEENWQLVIDPDGARPPLSPEEINDELEHLRDRYPMDARTVTHQDALKRACALGALDGIVMEMQFQYDQVCRAYVELRGSLSK